MVAFTALTFSPAYSQKPIIYVCVDERSVGFDPRENGQTYVGKFNPDSSPMIVKFTPAVIDNGWVTALPWIAVTEDGKTRTFELTNCIHNPTFIIGKGRSPEWGRQLLFGCATFEPSIGPITFGTGLIVYNFYGDIYDGETPIQYLGTYMGGPQWAYLDSGTCILQ